MRDQYVNQTPMGVSEGAPILTLRLADLEAVLRIWRYPRGEWSWLIESARMIHALVTKADRVEWYAELGKPYDAITPDDVGWLSEPRY